jgi:hypothetical protein
MRPLHVAEQDWKRISLELRMFDRPERGETGSSISIEEQTRRRTIVSGKWIFNSREVR